MSDPAAPWFDRCPELLEWELERFGQWDMSVTIDEELRAEGRLVLDCETSLDGKPVPTQVMYPSEYPELPPLIFGPPGLLDRHQHRFGGNFCLLERPLDDWPAGEWGAADLLGERLTSLFRDTEAGPETVRRAEAPMPEPVSTYYATASDFTVLIGEGAEPTGATGTLAVRLLTRNMLVVVNNGKSGLEEPLAQRFESGEEIDAPWIRLPAAPAVGPDGAAVARWLRSEHPELLARELPPKLATSHRLPAPPPRELCCLVFPEEGPRVGETRDGYLFLMVERGPKGKRETLLKAQILSRSEQGRRIPELAGLAGRRALVIGAGTLGGDIAVELAKAGVGEVESLDYDMLEVGNSVRHRLGLESVGMPKAQGVTAAAERANPFCLAKQAQVHLGAVEWNEQSPLARLAYSVSAADIVMDASGSHQIANLVSRVCAEVGRPMVAAWLSECFYGAEVVRIRPGETMCWTCFATAQHAGELLRAEEGPPSQVSAQGCSHPTTAGAGFDALEAAAVATRLAVQTLSPDGGYPDCEWDHVVLNFRRQPGDVEHPRVATERLVALENCERCKASAGSGVALSATS